MIMAETKGKSCSTRYEPKYKDFWFYRDRAEKLDISHETEKMHQATSWGLMQVMGATARSMGFDDHIPKLCQDETSIKYGVKYLKKQFVKYGNYQDAVAAYNAGHVKKTKGGFYKPGITQRYVDKVFKYYRELTKIE